MRLTWRDAVAAVLVAGVVTLYAAFVAGHGVTPVAGPRALAGGALLLGLAACAVGARVDPDRAAGRGWAGYVLASVLGAVALVAALLTMLTGSTITLGVLVATTGMLWLYATVRHATEGRVRDSELRRLVERTPVQRKDELR